MGKKKKSGIEKLTKVILNLTTCVLAFNGLLLALATVWHTIKKL
ncbi:MAG: hypothetical protein ACRCWG_02995 [Sarcina sp.]